MMFFGKRQSQDSVLRQRILECVGDSTLWMSEYSAKMFGESDCIRVDQDYMNKVGDNDFCFIEDGPYLTDHVSEIFLCHLANRTIKVR